MIGGISEKAIEERAYHIWQREGCPHGRDYEHWVQAQVELEAEARRNGGRNGAVVKAKPARAAAAAKAKPAIKAAVKPRAVKKPPKKS